MASTTKILTAFIAGALAGASIGLLLAPEKGKDSREKVKNTIDELSKEGQKIYDEYKKRQETETADE